MENEKWSFNNSYIERSNKETEEKISSESADFLEKSIQYLKKEMNEFIYIEDELFDKIGVDGVSLEVDDLFHTYDVMLGLKLPKKQENTIRTYLNNALKGEDIKFDLMFDGQDGLWNLNFTLDYVDGFREDMSILEAYRAIYQLLSSLVDSVKNN
ncbi:branched-chain amino acid aminotransferase [Bacillus dakarensis]|uniref:branched-chain amino acid aminotransferase n=1 Tax=Robertmurraya dakarensis TaxID=1926278 RepID=UPI0009815BD0|nr:branched-chain amino acid aminotransferase [Bacillus dakarensis]